VCPFEFAGPVVLCGHRIRSVLILTRVRGPAIVGFCGRLASVSVQTSVDLPKEVVFVLVFRTDCSSCQLAVSVGLYLIPAVQLRRVTPRKTARTTQIISQDLVCRHNWRIHSSSCFGRGIGLISKLFKSNDSITRWNRAHSLGNHGRTNNRGQGSRFFPQVTRTLCSCSSSNARTDCDLYRLSCISTLPDTNCGRHPVTPSTGHQQFSTGKPSRRSEMYTHCAQAHVSSNTK
jgi:hypothetical protein